MTTTFQCPWLITGAEELYLQLAQSAAPTATKKLNKILSDMLYIYAEDEGNPGANDGLTIRASRNSIGVTAQSGVDLVFLTIFRHFKFYKIVEV